MRRWDEAPHSLNALGLCNCQQCAQSSRHCPACAERLAKWAAPAVAPVAVEVILVDDRDAPRCQRADCDNVLTGRQTMFCSKTCGGAVRQQHFRDRDLIQLSATDVDLVAATLQSPRDFRRAVNRAWKNAERPIDLGSGVTVDPEVLQTFRESARRP